MIYEIINSPIFNAFIVIVIIMVIFLLSYNVYSFYIAKSEETGERPTLATVMMIVNIIFIVLALLLILLFLYKAFHPFTGEIEDYDMSDEIYIGQVEETDSQVEDILSGCNVNNTISVCEITDTTFSDEAVGIALSEDTVSTYYDSTDYDELRSILSVAVIDDAESFFRRGPEPSSPRIPQPPTSISSSQLLTSMSSSQSSEPRPNIYAPSPTPNIVKNFNFGVKSDRITAEDFTPRDCRSSSNSTSETVAMFRPIVKSPSSWKDSSLSSMS